MIKYMVFYRYSDEIRLEFFETAHGSNGLHEFLDANPKLNDLMGGNGLRETTRGDLDLMLAGKYRQMPEKSFIVIKGLPIQLAKVTTVTQYRVSKEDE